MKRVWLLALLAASCGGEDEEAPPPECVLEVEGEEFCLHSDDDTQGLCCRGSVPGMLDICTAYRSVVGACSWMVDDSFESGTPLLDHPCREVVGLCKDSWSAEE